MNPTYVVKTGFVVDKQPALLEEVHVGPQVQQYCVAESFVEGSTAVCLARHGKEGFHRNEQPVPQAPALS